MPPVIAFVFAIGLPLLLYSFMMFDRIVRAGYENDKPAWVAAGKPRGFFWRVPEGGFLKGSLARNKLSLVWLFQGPSWAAKIPECRVYLKRLRLCVLLWNINVLLVAAYLICFRF